MQQENKNGGYLFQWSESGYRSIRTIQYTYTGTVCKNPKLCGAARVFLLLIHGATGVQPSILVGGIDAPTFEITFSSKLVDNLGGRG